MSDPYVYPGTNTLINRFNIKKQEKLQELESAFYRKAMSEELPNGRFDYAHLKAIHAHLFGEVYPWAGKERTVDIAKENSFFAHTQYISKELNKLFSKLEQDQYLKGLNKEQFCDKIAHYFNEINAAHPFREGNGRTQRAFCEALAKEAGFVLDWGKVTRETYILASVEGFKGNDSSMIKVMHQITSPLIKEHEHVTKQAMDTPRSSEMLKHKHLLDELTYLTETRKKLSGYAAEKVTKAIASKATEILTNKQLTTEIRSNAPKLLKLISSVSKETSKGIER